MDMRYKLLSALAGLGVLSMAGCQSGGGEQLAEAVEPAPTSQSQVQEDAAAAASLDETQEPSPDIIMAFTPPAIGTRIKHKVTGRQNLTTDSVVDSHDATYNGQRAWSYTNSHRTTYMDFSNNRLGRVNPDGSPQETFLVPREFYRFPMKPGDSWETSWKNKTFKNDRIRNGSAVVKVVGWETIKVPAGSFRVMKIVHDVRWPGGTGKRTVWFSPDLGMEVKGQDLWKGGSVRWTVTDYQRP